MQNQAHGKILGRVITIILVLFFLVYTAFQTFRFFFVSYQTESAYIFEVARVYTTNGLLVREEKAIEQAGGAAVRYTLPEGGKFIGTSTIATVYDSPEAAALAEQSEQQRQELALLQQVAQSANASIHPDLSTLNDNIYTTLRDHISDTNRGQVGDTDRVRLQLINNITRIQTAVDSSVTFAPRITELETELAKIPQGQAIQVPGNGYFSRFSDGREADFTPEMLDSMTLQQFNEYIQNDYPYRLDVLGKEITDYNWYYVTTLPSREAELFQPDTKMTLSFIGSDDTVPVSGWVRSATEDYASGLTLLVIQSNGICEDAVARRTATVKLGFEDYRGIRFSKKALRIQDGVKGVYVRGKSSIKFKKVDIVYTGMDFYLSKLDYNSETYLNIFDEIVVEGTNLYDGKPLE